MISDEEIDTLVEQHKRAPEEVYYRDFARAIYQLGRQHQRESDAALCRKLSTDPMMSSEQDALYCEEAILNNTGELK